MNKPRNADNQIKKVSSFNELANTKFEKNNNALCWERNLIGNFEEIVLKLQLKENVTEISIDDLLSLQLSENGNIARQIIINDLQLLTDFGASPLLNLIKNYERDDEIDFFATDVYSYHVDRSPIATDTFLCTYYGASSDIIANDQAIQKILVPEIRKKLQEIYKGKDEDFESFLIDNYFDLHYNPKPDSTPINLGIAHLWKLAVDHPQQQVLPCIHRAPKENNNEYRLLLIC